MREQVRTTDGVLTLPGFYLLMDGLAAVRRRLAAAVLSGKGPSSADIQILEAALKDLEQLPQHDGRFQLALKAGPESDLLGVDLEYELGELAKDLIYLGDGEDALVGYMAAATPGFVREVEALAGYVGNGGYTCFVTDRDGTVNNYCSHYRSSIQSVYNAVFLTRFARRRCDRAVLLTSAPLSGEGPGGGHGGGGLVDVHVMPPGQYVLAGSKGREYIDLNGQRGTFSVEPEKQAVLTCLNARLQEMLAEPGMRIFGLVGSGLQFKFGQTTLARQDVGGSIAPDASRALLGRVSDMVRDLDPAGTVLRIEDTGLDIEIMLTVQGSGGLKDFDKGDGLDFLDGILSLGLDRGPNLVCGDTSGDVPMLAAVLRKTGRTKGIFVTVNPDLKDKVRSVLPTAAFVSSPDALVVCLGMYA